MNATKIIGIILSYFGYTKVPKEAVQLIVYIRYQLRDYNNPNIQEALKSLEELFRSGRKLSY